MKERPDIHSRLPMLVKRTIVLYSITHYPITKSEPGPFNSKFTDEARPGPEPLLAVPRLGLLSYVPLPSVSVLPRARSGG